MDKLAETSRRAFIRTLLTGKADEAVEQFLEFADYHKKDGDAVIWKLLDAPNWKWWMNFLRR